MKSFLNKENKEINCEIMEETRLNSSVEDILYQCIFVWYKINMDFKIYLVYIIIIYLPMDWNIIFC